MVTKGSVQKGRVAVSKKSKKPISKTDLFTRDIMIIEITNLVKVMNIKEIEGWEDIPFQKISTLKNQTHITNEELSVLLDLLDNMFEEMRFRSQDKKLIFNKRDQIINEIINHVKVMNVEEIEGWEDIPFGKINSLRDQTHITNEELSILLKLLEDMSEGIALSRSDRSIKH